MQIPKRFKLMGLTIDVVFVDEPFIEEDGWGQASFRRNEIQIRPNNSSNPRKSDQMMHTYFHELVHFILYFAYHSYSGKEEVMYRDEGFVDTVAGLLHQAITTAEYE